MNNLKKKLRNLTQIEDWHDNLNGNISYLESLFEGNFNVYNNVFEAIWISVRQNPQSAEEEINPSYEYMNVGFSTKEITEYFNVRYGLNYFLYDFRNESDFNNLKNRIRSIYHTNLYKYVKLVEVMGYQYNPLFNVDGTELYSNMESIGDSSNERKPTGKIRTTSGTLSDGTIGDSTTKNYDNPYDSNASGDPSYLSSKTVQNAITTDQEYLNNYSDKSTIDNLPATQFVKSGDTITKTDLYNMAAKDSAFGVALNGAERYYAEKRIRQGNIGVTKTTELIEAQREAVRYNILDEFFRDLYREIVVGIY